MNLLLKHRDHLFFILALIILAIITHHVWFFNTAPITQGDWLYDHLEKLKEYAGLPRIWQMSNSLGTVNLGAAFWPIYFIQGILARFNLGYEIGERVLFLWTLAIITPLSMYFLAYHIFRHKISAFVGAIVFSFNAFFLTLETGPLTLRMAMGITPLFILFMIMAFERKKPIFIIFAGLIAFIISIFEFRIFYLALWLLGVYWIYYFIFINKIKDIKELFRSLLAASPIIFIPLFLNIYWLLTMKTVGSLVSNDILSRDMFGTSFVDMPKAITLFPYLWTGGSIRAFEVQPIPVTFFFIPFFAVIGLLFNRRNYHVIYFTIIGLLGIILVKQIAEPFPDLYKFLFNHLPGFKAFRESTKFYYFIAISYSILISGLISVLSRWADGKVKKVIFGLITILIVSLFLWNTKPLISGEIGTLFIPRKIPDDYLVYKNFVYKQKEYFRTLWVPTFSRWTFYSDLNPKLSAVQTIENYWSNLSTYRPSSYYFSYEKQIANLFNQPYADRLFDNSSIKYFLVPSEDRENEDDAIMPFGSRNVFISNLDNYPYLKKIDIGTLGIIIYENKNYKPHIYVTERLETIKENIPYVKVKYDFFSPTEYKIKLSDISKPVYLNFSESYGSDWKVKTGNYFWLNTLLNKKYFLDDKYHLKNDAGLNSFLIDPSVICQTKGNCLTKGNTNYEINLTLFFQPQNYMYLGVIISAVTFIICLSYLVYYIIRRLSR